MRAVLSTVERTPSTPGLRLGRDGLLEQAVEEQAAVA